ncbi:MAG: efflux transporter outer membrane subunit [Novosphingobium sp.]|jgi:NodT family efflux transporter outer membrane factor (OMF) lipoprotein|nr:efflux transporter outer membrane subunit [Novosphingobium sp.]
MRNFLPLTALALLCGCTMGPDFTPPAAPPQAGYAGDGNGRAALGEGPGPAWWQAFGSPELDALVDRAIASNHSLAASQATLERARAQIDAARGKMLPQIDANARAEYERLNLSAFGFDAFASNNGQSISNPTFDLYTLGGGVSYDLDLFGRNRRSLEQTIASAEATQRQTEAAHLVIAGRVVQQVLAIASLNDRIATVHALLREDERNVDLTQKRQRAGIGTLVEVLSAQAQLADDRGALPALEQQLAEGRGMLAVLLGISPAELGPTGFTLEHFTLPAQVPVAMPSALVHKRPDILEAEARLHAATAAVGVATAQLYPNITLGATLSQSTSAPESIFTGRYRGYDIFGGLTAPIFHGGTLKAQKRGAEAEARAAAATYRETVVQAFGQVSNLLSALQTDGTALATRQEAAQIAERSLYLSRRSFQVGNTGILQVLDASRTHQRAGLALVEARSQQYLNVARLYAATAGGWTGTMASDAEAGPP